ncbi:ExeM/NucH family extracellular endonuclease [Duganella sp. P38]|uniref:ExeM/NucH family extracellular endonuclease n=1 Tax=Duganella sp. P38 TaxID=3423949 RepID=UPI003D7A073D
MLQPGQYYLVQQATGAGGSTDLPAPDATGAIAMSASAGKVALVSSSTALSGAAPAAGSFVDLVGFGGANYAEGAPTATLSNTSAALRAGAGCTDTDNNSGDFATGAPAPRNSASPRNQCGVPQQPPIVATCPANLALAFGVNGGAELSATDADGTVNSALITSAAVPGISLANFVAASGAGGTASANLNVAASVQAGTYPVVVKFGNDQAQEASCTISVHVSAPAALSHTIPQIQGEGDSSPYANTIQTTEGVVTAKVGSGFFIQDENGDGNPLTSDGLFVYTTAANIGTVQVNDKIRITGTVSEYTPSGASRSYTELTNVTAITKLGAGSITPSNVQLPHANLGQVEGMLVRFTSPLTVSQLEYLGARGEVTLSSGRLEIASNRYRPRSAEAIAQAAANQRNQIILDDGIFVTPTTIPYLGEDGSLRAGDSVHNLTGVIDFGAKGGGGAAFKLQPTEAPQFSQDHPREAPPALAAGNVKVASANVLNYFTTFTNGTDVNGNSNVGCTLGSSVSKSNCRGADNLNEFQRQSAKIVGELKAIDADVYGLMEIQNSGEATVGYLVDALNEAIAPGTGFKTYAVVPKPAATGTDAIRVAMIYKPSRLTLVGNALSDADAINNRPPMAQTFKAANGARFSVVVNHLKSKGSCPSGSGADADQNDSQSCWNATRVQQAQRLVNSFVPQVVAAAGDARVLLIGDFNAYGQEDPIAAITASGYVNQLERFVRGAGQLPYSYVFNGEAGYLDHALASAALNPQVADAAEWHNNADEPTVLDYNTDGKPEDKYTSAPYRASDHDPVVISLKLQAAVTDVSASVRSTASALVYNRASARWSGSVTLTNTGSAPLSGPFQLQFDGLNAGATLAGASGTHDGAPYLSANQATLAPGASITVPTSFSKTGGGGVTYSAIKIYSGNF